MSKYVVGAAAAEEFAPAEDNDEEEEDEQEDLGKNIAQAIILAAFPSQR